MIYLMGYFSGEFTQQWPLFENRIKIRSCTPNRASRTTTTTKKSVQIRETVFKVLSPPAAAATSHHLSRQHVFVAGVVLGRK